MTLLELAIGIALTSLVLLGLAGVTSGVLQARAEVQQQNDLNRQARFAMGRMVAAASAAPMLLLPMADNPGTARDESVRDLLAVTLDPRIDRDGDGWPDADNDKDGRIDEDLGRDASKDGCAGLCDIDDDGDGLTDGVAEPGEEEDGADGEQDEEAEDDDEDGATDEDPVNGIDDDLDGRVDEDAGKDMNDDGKPGIKDVDDDGDLLVDEGGNDNDDEDLLVDEERIDPVVFHLQGTRLVERNPVPWDVDANLFVDGNDWIEQTLAEGVSELRVERTVGAAGRHVLLDITLELTAADGDSVRLTRRVRLGAGL